MKTQMIARIHTDFPEKFGIPRQSGLTELRSYIVFEKEYRSADALRGLEDFSHIWLLWEFSLNKGESHGMTVRPPRLGGNERMGVFATRSPYRPNPIGLSSVKLERIIYDLPNSPVIEVSGADLADGTPVIDIKPYLAFTDSHPNAKGGFSESVFDYSLTVDFPEALLCRIPPEKRDGLTEILREDPRPSYHSDPERVYGMKFADFEIKFKVREGVLSVLEVI